MPLLEIKKYPNPILKKKGEEIREVNAEIRELASEMLHAMYKNKGIGLAAQQVGIAKKILVCDIGEGPLVLINPKIIAKTGKCLAEEGCLSFPGVYINIKRAKEVEIKALNLEGKESKIIAGDLLARVLQHEIDHLNGSLFISKLWFWQRKKVFTLLNKNH